MTGAARPEPWLRGPVAGVPPLLQPVAHALMQASEDAERALERVPADRLWERPGGAASAGFHALHAAGALDRLFTYARGESLSEKQLAALRAEQSERGENEDDLLRILRAQIDAALAQLRATDERTLTDRREVGRARLPSTVIGLLFHAAEHTQRHVGQLIATSKIIASR